MTIQFVGPDLHRVGAGLFQGWWDSLLDFGEGVEVGLELVERRNVDRPTLKDEVVRFISDALADPRADLFGASRELGLTFASEGPSRRRMLERILERYRGGPADLEVVNDVTAQNGDVAQRFPNPFFGRFLDGAAADDACTLVLRQHDTVLREWDSRARPSDRLALRGDVAQRIGELFFREGGEPLDSSFVTVLMVKTKEGKPYIHGAYPDLAPDPVVAEAYPDLPQLFAAFFGQDWTDNDRTLWNAEHIFHMGVEEPQAQRLRDQVDALIDATGSQDEMRHALTSLGSAVLPQAAQQWVQRIRGRMDPTIWHPEQPDA